jgi:catalase
VRTRRVAILIADGVEGKSLLALHSALTEAGAVPRFVGPRLGSYAAAAGGRIEADASMENSPPVLFDALVLPDGADGVRALAADGHTSEFITNQYRHCKAILALGASRELLDGAGIATSRSSDPGLLLRAANDQAAPRAFIAALAKHRHPSRETDPPMV